METETLNQTSTTETVWHVDPEHSVVGFTAKHMLIATVRGHFDKYSATVIFDPDAPEKSRVEATIEAASINTGNAQRDTHLRSADFFDAEHFPQITFQSSRLVRESKDHWKLSGVLMIRGQSKSLTLDMEGFSEIIKDPWGNFRVGGTAAASINRFDYGLHWNASIETGGLVVGEKINIALDIELMRKVS